MEMEDVDRKQREETTLIKSGRCRFQGICDYRKPRNYYDEDEEIFDGYLFRINDKNYVAVENPSDGYRSYCEIEESDAVCTNTFPDQEVFVLNYDETRGYNKNWGIEIYNIEDGSLILKISTENYDDYYPMAVMEYHPENMPINKGR